MPAFTWRWSFGAEINGNGGYISFKNMALQIRMAFQIREGPKYTVVMNCGCLEYERWVLM